MTIHIGQREFVGALCCGIVAWLLVCPRATAASDSAA
jgi:hypothetical protein